MKICESIGKVGVLVLFALFALVSCVPVNGGYGGYDDGPYSHGETRVPHVVGSQRHEAERILRDYDLRVGNVEYVSTNRRNLDGQVESQFPDAGRYVSQGTRVRLRVFQSDGHRPGDHRPPGQKPWKVEVPSLEGRELNEARDILRRNDLRAGRIEYRETREKKRDGRVETQYPKAGDRVERETEVRLTVYRYEKPGHPGSRPPDGGWDGGAGGHPPNFGQTAVPDLSGRTVDKAKQILRNSDLKTGRIDYVNTGDKRRDGEVGSQNPGPGASVKKGTAVSLSVYRYKGYEQSGELVKIPNVKNRPLDQARRILQESGLGVGAVTYKSASQRDQDGLVFMQDPTFGGRVVKGTRVDLVVYRFEGGHGGWRENGDHGKHDDGYSSKRDVVPNVVGSSLGEARRRLSGNGFDVGKINEARTTVKSRDGHVFKQAPPPGTKANRNASVDLWVYKF